MITASVQYLQAQTATCVCNILHHNTLQNVQTAATASDGNRFCMHIGLFVLCSCSGLPYVVLLTLCDLMLLPYAPSMLL